MMKANQGIRLFVIIILLKARKETDMCIKKWIAVLSALCVAVSLIAGCAHLTKESRNKQDNRPTIIVGSDIFPPYNYTDEHGNPAGIDLDSSVTGRCFERLTGKKKMSWSSQGR